MTAIQLSSYAMLQPPAFATAAEQAISRTTQPRAENSGSPLASVGLEVRTSLTGDAQALKAQQRALDHLDSVLSTAQGVFRQIAPLLPSDGPAAASTVDSALRNATYHGAPLFDAGINSRTIGTLIASDSNTLSLFSPEVRGALQSSFDSAFDLYA